MKKCFAKALAALPLLATVVAYADGELATETVGDYTWTYRIVDGTAEIFNDWLVAISPDPYGAVAIPSALGGRPVASIGGGAFSSCGNLTSVTIPDSVANIGWLAFAECDGLTSVTIPSGVTNIAYGAFRICRGLTSFSVADGNTAYKSVSGLLLTKDGETLVAGINGDVAIPIGVTYIGEHAFSGCSGLTSVTIPASVTCIGYMAFDGCSGLTSITIPRGVTSIDGYAFSDCVGLTHLTIPDSVTEIRFDAFLRCNRLESVTIGNGVARIGDSAFSWCSGLTSFSVANDNASYKSVSGLLLTKDGNTIVAGINGDVVVPNSVTNIGESAFQGLGNLTSVTIPDSVTDIGKYAFRDCDELANILIPRDIKGRIDESVFMGCPADLSVVYYEGEPPTQLLHVTTTALPSAMELVDYEETLRAEFSTGYLYWYVEYDGYGNSGLPDGFGLSSDGKLTGCATQAGTYPFTVTVVCRDARTGSLSETSGELSLTVDENPNRKPSVSGAFPADDADVILPTGQSQLFTVTASDPEGTQLTYVWLVDGVEVQSGTMSNYTFCANNDNPGVSHEVICYVNDDLWTNIVNRSWMIYVNKKIYVDAANGNDANDGFSKATAVATLQVAIDRSVDGDTIIVGDGVYAPIATRNQRIVIESENGYKTTVIDGGRTNNCALLGGIEPFVADAPLMYGEVWQGTNTVLRGFTLRNGAGAWGAGVTAGTVESCLIVDNVVEAYPFDSPGPNGLGGGAFLSVLRNCTITGNSSVSAISNEDDTRYGGIGGGSYNCTLFNCIEWDNFGDSDEIGSGVSVYEGCCTNNPRFANPANGDYRLLSDSPCAVDDVVVAGCETEIVAACENGMPVISSEQAEAWVADDLAQRFAKPGESAADYRARFAAKFGSDPVAAMTKPTDKRDRDGFAMYVWQDYVAGTDPTDTNSVFTAKVEMVDGSPVVTWEPKLSAAEEARRIYTVYGKTNLTDRAWHSPTNAASRFFKVNVEMR